MKRTKSKGPVVLKWEKVVWEHLGGWRRDRKGPELFAIGRVYDYMLIPDNGRWFVRYSATKQFKTAEWEHKTGLDLRGAKAWAQNFEITGSLTRRRFV